MIADDEMPYIAIKAFPKGEKTKKDSMMILDGKKIY